VFLLIFIAYSCWMKLKKPLFPLAVVIEQEDSDAH